MFCPVSVNCLPYLDPPWVGITTRISGATGVRKEGAKAMVEALEALWAMGSSRVSALASVVLFRVAKKVQVLECAQWLQANRSGSGIGTLRHGTASNPLLAKCKLGSLLRPRLSPLRNLCHLHACRQHIHR